MIKVKKVKKLKNEKKNKNMKKIFTLILFLIIGLTGWTMTDKMKNLEFRKNCDDADGNKTLADTFCKKSK